MVKTRRWAPRSWDELLAAYGRWRPLLAKGASHRAADLSARPGQRGRERLLRLRGGTAGRLRPVDGHLPQRRDILRRLYRVETGPATSELVEVGGAAYRQFQNALIVCNYSAQTVEVRVPVPPALARPLVELFEVRETPIAEGHVVLSLPAESGRVIVRRGRCAGQSAARGGRAGAGGAAALEKKDAGRNESSVAALLEQLQDVERRAAALRKNVHEAAFPTAADREAIAALSKDAAAVQTPSPRDGFLTERLDNLRRHAALAAQL